MFFPDGKSEFIPLEAGPDNVCQYQSRGAFHKTDVPNLMLIPLTVTKRKFSAYVLKKPASKSIRTKPQLEEEEDNTTAVQQLDEVQIIPIQPRSPAPIQLDEDTVQAYTICFYKKDNCIGIKKVGKPDRQILSFGRNTVHTEVELRAIAGDLVQALKTNIVCEEEAKQWVQKRLTLKD